MLGTLGSTAKDGSDLNGDPVYRVWNPAGTELLSYEINATSGGDKSDYHSYFQPVTIALASLKINGAGSDLKAGDASLTPYAGTYYFKLTCTNQGILYNGAIASCANLATAYGATGTQAVAFTVTIASADGAVTDGAASLTNVKILVEGKDDVHTDVSSPESTALGVDKDTSTYDSGYSAS